MNELKVSAIITTCNRLSLLQRAVGSVLSQTYSNIELIVIDDNSIDGTEEWCKSNGITIYKSPFKGGNIARNTGIKNATGDYIAFLDDDDFWYENKISKQVEIINSTNGKVVYCGIRKVFINSMGHHYEDIIPKPLNIGDVSNRILQEIFTITSALMVERELLLDVGLFDETISYWQEYELCIRLAQKAKFYAVNDILVGYMVNPNDKNRLTNKYYDWKKNVKIIHDKHSEKYKQLNRIEKIYAKRVVIWDAISRCNNAGLKYQKLYNQFKLRFSFILEKYIKK